MKNVVLWDIETQFSPHRKDITSRLRSGGDGKLNILYLIGARSKFDPLAVHAVASRYSDCVTPASKCRHVNYEIETNNKSSFIVISPNSTCLHLLLSFIILCCADPTIGLCSHPREDSQCSGRESNQAHRGHKARALPLYHCVGWIQQHCPLTVSRNSHVGISNIEMD
jgi:hypothetical protein